MFYVRESRTNYKNLLNKGKVYRAMSNKERVMKLIEDIPEHKLVFVIDILESLQAYAGETIEPDEWDLKMIKEAKEENNNQGISIETLASELGITL